MAQDLTPGPDSSIKDPRIPQRSIPEDWREHLEYKPADLPPKSLTGTTAHHAIDGIDESPLPKAREPWTFGEVLIGTSFVIGTIPAFFFGWWAFAAIAALHLTLRGLHESIVELPGKQWAKRTLFVRLGITATIAGTLGALLAAIAVAVVRAATSRH